MRKLTRPNEPQELTNARRSYRSILSPDAAWKEFGQNGDRTIVREELEITQECLCAYCENSLDESHIDHFKPKSLGRHLTFDWDNLIVSCCYSDSCGSKKSNDFQSYWVNPYLTDPDGLFTFYTDGQIKGNTTDAEKIIIDFGLDCPGLEEKRKGILSKFKSDLLTIAEYPDALEYFLAEEAEIFPTAHKQIIRNLT